MKETSCVASGGGRSPTMNVELIVNVLDLTSFLLVTPDLVGKERWDALDAYIQRILTVSRGEQGILWQFVGNEYIAFAGIPAALIWVVLSLLPVPNSVVLRVI